MVIVDNTLGAVSHSVKEIVKEEGDDYFVVVMSDANITQYNIHPNDIARGKIWWQCAYPLAICSLLLQSLSFEVWWPSYCANDLYRFSARPSWAVSFVFIEMDLMKILTCESRLQKALGSQATICSENKDLPKIMKALFLASMVK